MPSTVYVFERRSRRVSEILDFNIEVTGLYASRLITICVSRYLLDLRLTRNQSNHEERKRRTMVACQFLIN